MNDRMHRDNPFYKNPPDFLLLSQKYPEFRKHVTILPGGKRAVLDWKDPASVR